MRNCLEIKLTLFTKTIDNVTVVQAFGWISITTGCMVGSMTRLITQLRTQNGKDLLIRDLVQNTPYRL